MEEKTLDNAQVKLKEILEAKLNVIQTNRSVNPCAEIETIIEKVIPTFTDSLSRDSQNIDTKNGGSYISKDSLIQVVKKALINANVNTDIRRKALQFATKIINTINAHG